MASSAGKRQREQQKLERARAKAERKVARQATAADEVVDVSPRNESELIEELGVLQWAFGAGEISPDQFEKRREEIQAQFERLSG